MAADILIFGSGGFAARIAFDIAATAREPVGVAIASRNAARLSWLRTAGNARATLFGTPARFAAIECDLDRADEAARVIAACQPKVVMQAASAQTSQVIRTGSDGWARLIAEGGLSASAPFQALLTLRVARAIPTGVPFVNGCFPDVVNAMVAAAGLPVACGTGNVAILSTAMQGHLGPDAPRVQVLAQYQCLSPFRTPPASRPGKTPPRVWLDGAEVGDVFDRFAALQLTTEPAIEISGASGVPLLLAMAAGRPWSGHVPGPHGLPGGYPVRWTGTVLDLDLPEGITRTEAVAWNAAFERRNGMVVEDGIARPTGMLRDRLRALSPALAEGFAVRDLETALPDWAALRARLQAER